MKKTALFLALALCISCLFCACGTDTPAAESAAESSAAKSDEPASMPDYIDIVADDSEAESSAPASAGGWQKSADGVITAEAQAAFDKAIASFETDGISYTPVSLLGTQVVAGINYAFVCDGKPTDDENAAARSYKLIVYADLEGNAEITSVEPYPAEQ